MTPPDSIISLQRKYDSSLFLHSTSAFNTSPYYLKKIADNNCNISMIDRYLLLTIQSSSCGYPSGLRSARHSDSFWLNCCSPWLGHRQGGQDPKKADFGHQNRHVDHSPTPRMNNQMSLTWPSSSEHLSFWIFVLTHFWLLQSCSNRRGRSKCSIHELGRFHRRTRPTYWKTHHYW